MRPIFEPGPIILGCNKTHIDARTRDTNGRFKCIGRFTTLDAIKTFLKANEGRIIMRSSSMDFPEEETKDRKILKLAKQLM